MKGKGFLRIASIFILIWGLVNITAGIFALSGFSMFEGILPSVKSDLTALVLFRLLGVGIFEVIAAVYGFKAAHDKSKAKVCFFLGGLVFAVTITSLFADSSNIEWTSYIASNFFPILYLIGAYLRKSHQD